MLTIAWFAIVVVLYSYGRGIVGYALPLSIVGPLEAAAGVIWIWSMNMTRVSMCLMILRVKTSKQWKWSLWGLTAVQIGLIIAATSVNLNYCHPLTAAWKPNPDDVCLKPSQMKAFGYTYNCE